MTRAQFYFLRSLHTPGLLPIYRELKKRSAVEIGFCIPYDNYDPRLKAGFKEDEDAVLRSEQVEFFADPKYFKSDVVFVADALAPVVQNAGKIVNAGHGLLSKGMFFTDRAYIERENLNDLLLVPGEWHKQRILSSGRVHIPVEAVGYPKIDPIFNGEMQSRERLCQMAGLDPAKNIVLYAPTYNIELSALTHLWTRIQELATEDRYLLIKLHGATMPEIVEAHKLLAATNENIRFIADADITPYLQLADVMVSDVSSAAWEYILLDKPIVFFNNPNWSEFPHYDPNDIEFAWRDVGLQANDLEETKDAVNRSLEQPQELAFKRQEYINRLGIPCDGKASVRAVDATLELLRDGRPRNYRSRDRCLILTDKPDVKAEGYRTALGYSCEVKCKKQSNMSAVDLTDEDILIIDSRMRQGWDRWLFRLVNHLRCDISISAVVPMLKNGLPYQDPAKILADIEMPELQGEALDQYLKCTLTGQNVQLPDRPLSDIFAIRMTEEIKRQLMADFEQAVEQVLSNARLALDVLVEELPAGNDSVDDDIDAQIQSIADTIRQDVIVESETEKANRMAAEDDLRQARHFLGRRKLAEACEWAEKALQKYPACESARKILDLASEIAKVTT